MRWDKTSFSDVDACHGNAQSVDARKLICKGLLLHYFQGGWLLVFPGVVKPEKREVLCLHFGRVLADQTVNNGEIGGVANTESLVLGPHLMPWPSWVGELAATQKKKSASVTHDANKLKSS